MSLQREANVCKVIKFGRLNAYKTFLRDPIFMSQKQAQEKHPFALLDIHFSQTKLGHAYQSDPKATIGFLFKEICFFREARNMLGNSYFFQFL